ncbi:rubrerythrin [Thermococcus sp.]|uniref:rubrerythrin n=1 Tax=Thermococcus sp. TaxID=35749 RepID=UPI002613A3ED|nr:rubrerythrin [Thermococcus sp.]
MDKGAMPQWVDDVIDELSRLGPEGVFSHLISQELKRAELYHELYELSMEVTWDERVPKLFKTLYENSLKRAEEYVNLFHELFPGKPIEPPAIKAPGPRILRDRLWKLVYSGNVGEVIEYLLQVEELFDRILEKLESSLLGEAKTTLLKARELENTNRKLLRELYHELTGREPL